MYDGIVNIYKEQGFTSHDVVAKLRGIYGQKKVGHTGTLDPMAEGVLIVVLGKATKLADIIISHNKKYIATMRLGYSTTTDDITGEEINSVSHQEVSDRMGAAGFEEEVKACFEGFIGKSMQIPPKYSAIKVNGKKLYEYARAGIEVEIEPRPIEIYAIKLVGIDASTHEISFEVECSKGTYIRSLIRDMGERLGTYATMSALLRDEINGLYAKDAYRLSELQALKDEELNKSLADTVLPIESVLENRLSVYIKPEYAKLLSNGNRLPLEAIESIHKPGEESEEHSGGSSEGDLERTSELTSEGDISSKSIKEADFFLVYSGRELQALYTYDKAKNNFKVFKML